VLVLLLLARSAVDAVLLMLAWPRAGAQPPGLSMAPSAGLPRPRFFPSFLSCAVLTVLVWLVMSPVATLMFGVALLPFSWPYLAAVPILLGTALALSQGGVGPAWWRRLPPVRTRRVAADDLRRLVRSVGTDDASGLCRRRTRGTGGLRCGASVVRSSTGQAGSRWRRYVIFVDAFHGGLLGDVPVQQMVETFLGGGTVSSGRQSQPRLRSAAQLIAAAATAWRMPELRPACSS